MRPQVFKLEKTFKTAKYIKDAVALGWGRQILENSSRTMGITAVTVSACQGNVINLRHDQFEDLWLTIADIFWPSRFLRERTRLLLLFAISTFTKTLFMRAIHKFIILHHFNVFTGTLYRRASYSLPSRQVQSEACYSTSYWIAVFAAKHFMFFISPTLLKLEKEEKDLMIGQRRVNVLWYLAHFSSQFVKTTTIDSH